MKIVKDAQRKLVTPAQMQDGEIGVIRQWESSAAAIGLIVQKYGKKDIVVLGDNSSNCYDNAGTVSDDEYQIEILPPGTLLEI